jgi:arylsulfatase
MKRIGSWLMAVALVAITASTAQAQDRPNILVVWGDDIGQSNISAYTMGMMGYRTPNIDRIANEGMIFTDYYGEQSCTAGRSSFITGQSVFRTGLSKVGLPGADLGLRVEDPTIAGLLKAQGYATGQFGKNHLGDQDEFLPTNHGFDEFFGNLYHLNAEEEPEHEDYPADFVTADGRTFLERFGPRGVIHSYADGRIEDTGPLTKKRMETVDDETSDAAIAFIRQAHEAGEPFFVWWSGTRMHFRTHVKEELRGISGQDEYSDGMVEHATRPTTARTTTRGRMRPRRRSGVRRTRIGKVVGGYRRWSAGPGTSRLDPSRTRSSITWTGCRRSWRLPVILTSRRS